MTKQKCPKCGVVWPNGYAVAYDLLEPRPICPQCADAGVDRLKCPKCGSTEITTKWIAEKHRRNMNLPCAPFELEKPEHLRRKCTCEYAWDDPTLDSTPDSEKVRGHR